jgi:hypothetical protein
MRPDARNGGWCVFIETWEHFSRNWQWTASVIDLSSVESGPPGGSPSDGL